MRNGFNKFVKGYFAIFTIKLIFFGLILIIQSCQNDDSPFVESKQEVALKNFRKLVNSETPKTNQIIEDFQLTKRNYKSNQFKISSSKNNDIVSYQTLEEMEDKTELEAQISLMPLVISSKELLLTYGINDFDLAEEFIDLNDTRIAIIGMLALAIEDEYNSSLTTSINFSSLIGAQTVFAQTTVGNCILRASGIGGVASIFKNGLSATIKVHGKRYVINILGKALGRTLGWIGVGIALYDFADCMGWLSVVSYSANTNLSCRGDLLTVKLQNSTQVHLISKESINYTSQNDYYAHPTKQIPTYSVDFGNISIEDLNEESDCSVKKKSIIFSNYIDQNTIKEYNPDDLIIDFDIEKEIPFPIN